MATLIVCCSGGGFESRILESTKNVICFKVSHTLSMGIPALFRWLTDTYSAITIRCIEEKPTIVEEENIPANTSKSNPNYSDFDNLYLDMNGIIHPCCHPEDKPPPKDEEEMMISIFEYIDRIFNIVRPRRLLYMAIDGVAPRAKINQQRSRRFRSSKEVVEKVELIAKLREELQGKGVDLPPQKPKEEHFDNNCITPGTPFMARLAKCLHYYIHDRLNSDPGWRDIEVILSDANVPGEGEHKIMDFIRKQRSNPNYNANMRHCLCGADADLIMLGLATHEANFTIIREEFKPNQPRPCELCGQMGHELKECKGGVKRKWGKRVLILFREVKNPSDVKFLFIRLSVLREHLARELTMDNIPFPFDLERAIDDFIFLCFLIGNDFLPHLPSMEIREGAIDRLVELYKRVVSKTDGFITNSGGVELSRLQLIMTGLAEQEDEILKRRHEAELNFQARSRKKKQRNIERNKRNKRIRSENEANVSVAQGVKRKKEDTESEEEPEPEDDVKLWEDGGKDKYYQLKFKVDSDDIAFRHKVAEAYVEGLSWVLKYYYQGCASWSWYFPYHYAPFASDFVNIGDIKIDFDKGTPFKPLEQLMAVFPAASKNHIPEPWGELMENPESPIIDFYPTDFIVDLNGKRYAWPFLFWVALLPIVDDKRLLKALEAVYPKLTEEENKRNLRGKDKLYVRNGHSGYEFLTGLYENRSNWKLDIDMIPKLFSGIIGTVILSEDVIHPKANVPSPLPALPDIPGNSTVCVKFVDPQYPENYIFPAERLKSAEDPPKVLKPGQMPVPHYRNR